jgi:hypothetical protein
MHLGGFLVLGEGVDRPVALVELGAKTPAESATEASHSVIVRLLENASVSRLATIVKTVSERTLSGGRRLSDHVLDDGVAAVIGFEVDRLAFTVGAASDQGAVPVS